MSEFHLKIVTPERMAFDDMAESIIARSVTGDVCVLAGHTEYITPLGIGPVKVNKKGEVRIASCNGGILVVKGEEVSVVADTFEWQS